MKVRTADLPPVARTLLIPLAYRAIENSLPNPILFDPCAAEVLSHFDEPIVSSTSHPNADQVSLMMRARQVDRFAREFLAAAPEGSVVDIGCGLDTRFQRLDNGRLQWFALDFPQVIALREQLLPRPDPGRFTHIGGSALEPAWLEVVARGPRPVLFLAEGVVAYLTAAEVTRLLSMIRDSFPGSEFVCDVISRFSARVHRWDPAVRRAGVTLGWGTDDSKELERMVPGVRVLEECEFLLEPEPRLGFYRAFSSWPIMRRSSRIVHLRMGDPAWSPQGS